MGEETGAFGYANGAARVEQIKGVRTANDVVVCGDDEVAVEGCLGFGYKDVVHGFEAVDVGPVEFVVAVFDFLFFEDVAIGHGVVPL